MTALQQRRIRRVSAIFRLTIISLLVLAVQAGPAAAQTAAEWELFELPEAADLILGDAPGAGQAVSILPAPGVSGLLVEGVPIEQVNAGTIEPETWRSAAAFELFPGDTLVLLMADGTRFKLALSPPSPPDGTAPVTLTVVPLEEAALQHVTLPFYTALDLESGDTFTDDTIASVIFCQNIAIEPTPTPAPVPEPGSAGLLLLGLLGAFVSWRLARRKGRSVWMLLLLLSLFVGVQGIDLDLLTAQSRACLLLIEHDGDGSGYVTGDGIDCGEACSLSSASGEVYHVKATADSHSRFSHWLVNGAPYTGLVQMTGDTILTAVFDATYPPAAVNDRYSTDEDVPLQMPAPGILANDSDPDGDPLSAELVQSPMHGTLTLNPDGSFTYTPDPDFHGIDQFLYRVYDGELQSAIAVVTIDVLPVSEAPIAGDLSVETVMNHPMEIALQGHDPDGDSLLYHLVDLPANGTLSGADNQVIYTPNPDFTGQDTFTYRVNDGTADSNLATVTILVKHIDLAIGSIDLSQTVFDPQTMSLSGSATITIKNRGTEAVNGGYTLQLFVKDSQQNITITLGTVAIADSLVPDAGLRLEGPLSFNAQPFSALMDSQNVRAEVVDAGYEPQFFVNDQQQNSPPAPGEITMTDSLAPGSDLTLEVPVHGTLFFKDQPIYAFVDSQNVIVESNEENNISHSMVGCQAEPAMPGSFKPALEWEWTGSSINPASNQVLMAPVVANLNDDNLDGIINEGDIPDIIFTSYQHGDWYVGTLRAISGDGSGELFSIPGMNIDVSASPVVGDIDHDGQPEIVVLSDHSPSKTTAVVLIFEHDGSLKLQSETVNLDLYNDWWVASLAIADLENDNTPEIILGKIVLNNDGSIKWEGTYGAGRFNSVAANLDLEGRLEIVAGNTAYRSDGTVYWHNHHVPDGSPGIANFDQDRYPEIVVVGDGAVYVLEHTGQIKWGPVDIPPAGNVHDHGGAPTIADFDGDGEPEIGVAGGYHYTVIDSDGTVSWTSEIRDLTSSHTGSSVFDFDGDGMAEVVYADELMFRIYNGMDGQILYETLMGSGTGVELPVVADVDNDNNAEIVVVSNMMYSEFGGTKYGIKVFGDANDSWVNTRKIWNQHSYHITNVNDDGTIPQFEANSWEEHNTYRCNISADALACEDYSASYIRVDATGFPTSATIIARIGNAGIVDAAAPLNVAFYLGDPQNGGTLIGTTTTQHALASGDYEDVSLVWDAPTYGLHKLYVVVDDDGTGQGQIRESNETNNSAFTVFEKPDYDLEAAQVNTTQSVFDPATMQLSGSVAVTVNNLGSYAIESEYTVQVYVEDSANQTQNFLGNLPVSDALTAGGTLTLDVPVNGTLLFKDQPVYAFVDSQNIIAESDEENNIAHNLVNCQTEPAAPGSFEPVLEWEWTGSDVMPEYNQVMSTPAVANLNDDNGDGVVDSNDIPDIIFPAFDVYDKAIVRAISGDGNGELFVISEYFTNPDSNLAVGDIDGDSLVEIVMVEKCLEASLTFRVLAFEHTGAFKWASDYFEYTPPSYNHSIIFAAINIADLDNDTQPEIILGSVVLHHDGTTKWIGQYANGRYFSVVSDINLDSQLEIIEGGTAYNAHGEVLWQTEFSSGDRPRWIDYQGVANFDSDPYPEIVVVTAGYVYLLEHTGDIVWGPTDLSPHAPNTVLGGTPAIADVDSDGWPEIGVAGGAQYVVLETDGSLKWSKPAADISKMTGSSVFDFEGDGKAEIVYADEQSFFIYRGVDGEILFQAPSGSATSFEYPVIVDVDNDNNAEILVTTNDFAPEYNSLNHGIQIYGDANDSWVNTRKIWNQHSYHITNVNDDGTIPQFEANSWEEHNTYRCNISADALACEDYSASYVRAIVSGPIDEAVPRDGLNAEWLFEGNANDTSDYKNHGLVSGAALTADRCERELNAYSFNGSTDFINVSDSPSLDVAESLTIAAWVFIDNFSTNMQVVQKDHGYLHDYALVILSDNGCHHGHACDRARRFGLELTLDGVWHSEMWSQVPLETGQWYFLAATYDGSQVKLYLDGALDSVFNASGQIDTNNNPLRIGNFRLRHNDFFDGNLDDMRLYNRALSAEEITLLYEEKTCARMQITARVGNAGIVDAAAPLDVAFYLGDPQNGGTLIGTTITQSALASGEYEDVSLVWNTPPSGLHEIYVVVDDDGTGHGKIRESDEENNSAVTNALLNTPPQIVSIPILEFVVPSAFEPEPVDTYQYDAEATDPDGDALTYSLLKGPEGMSLDPLSGVISWKPGFEDEGEHEVELQVEDAYGERDSQAYLLTVIVENHPPRITSEPVKRAIDGELYTYDVEAVDPENDQLTFSLERGPLGMTIDPASGLIQWDLWETALQDEFAPLLPGFRVSVYADVTDPNGLSFAPNGTLYVGRDASGSGGGVLDPVSIHRIHAGGALVEEFGSPISDPDSVLFDGTGAISGVRNSVLVGGISSNRAYQGDITAIFPDGSSQAVLRSTSNEFFNPHDMVFDNNNRLIFMDANGGNVPHSDKIKAVEGGVVRVLIDTGRKPKALAYNSKTNSLYVKTDGIFDIYSIEGQLVTPNFVTGERLIIPPQNSSFEGSAYLLLRDNFLISLDENGNETPLGTMPGGITGMTFGPDGALYLSQFTQDRILRIAPHEEAVTVSVTDSISGADEQSFTLMVSSASNHFPMLTSSPDSLGVQDEEYLYDADAVDPDEEALRFSLTEFPEGMTIDPQTGLCRWTPDAAHTGLHTVRVMVTDEQGGFDEQEFTLRVLESKEAPRIISTPPTQAVAGVEFRYDVEAEDSPNDLLTYSLPDAPEGMTLDETSGALAWTPSAAQSGAHAVRVQVTDLLGLSDTQEFTVTVKTQGQPPQVSITAPTDGAEAPLDGSLTVQAEAGDPDGEIVKVEFYAENTMFGGGPVLFGEDETAPYSVSWTIVEPGIHRVIARAYDDSGTWADSAPVHIVVQNGQPYITSEPTYSAPIGELYSYDVEATDPNGDTLTYSLEYGPQGMTIDAASGLITWTPIAAQSGQHQFRVIVEDGRGAGAGQRVEMFVPEPNNTPPQIASQPVFVARVGEQYLYDVEATDADGDPLTFRFMKAVDGMGLNPQSGLITWTPTEAQIGTHAVTVVAEDGRHGIGGQHYTLTVKPANVPPTVSLSAPVDGRSIEEGTFFTFSAAATDSDGSIGSVEFFLDGVSIGSSQALPFELAWNAAGLGEHTLIAIATDNDGASTESAPVTFTVTESFGDFLRPEVTLTISSTAVSPGDTITVWVDAGDNSGSVITTLTVNGQEIPLDPDGSATYTVGSEAQILTIEASASDADGNRGSVTQEVLVLVPGDPVPPTAEITLPEVLTTLYVPTEITGTAMDPFPSTGSGNGSGLLRYTLEYSPKDRNVWTRFAEGTEPLTDGVLGTLDTTLLLNGLYDVRLTVEDASGNISLAETVYQVAGNMKIGMFTISFNDLTIPVSGIPITVTRTYDSRNPLPGDFGIGWTLSTSNIRLEESAVPGDEWEQVTEGGGGIMNPFLTYRLNETTPHKVTVTYPGGAIDEFRMKVTPRQSFPYKVEYVDVTFEAESGTFSTLKALENGSGLAVVGNVNGPVQLADLESGEEYNPKRYLLTRMDGTEILLNQNSGIETITDPNGNVLTFTEDGILHSNGKSVQFLRDPEGRIEQIIDPMGASVRYEYDSYGDLVKVTDQEGYDTRFTYEGNHYLKDIIDPRGVRATRNEYRDGRLVATIDPDGKRIEFDHDIEGRTEVIRDRLGYPTIITYDDRGNVLKETDAEGHSKEYLYDERDNLRIETDQLGYPWAHTYTGKDLMQSKTNPLGYQVSAGYNAKGQVETLQDNNGTLLTNLYDDTGNLRQITEAGGAVSSFTYHSNGQPESYTDQLENVMRFGYDSDGQVETMTDPDQNVINFEYDDNGRVLTKTSRRTSPSGPVTLETVNQYDKLGRLVYNLDAEGYSSEVVYNEIGKQQSYTDKRGFSTTYAYNALGNLERVTYPDNTEESYTYDPEGRTKSATNRQGKTSFYEYDKVGRQTKVTHPDNSFTETVYDPRGQVARQYDERRNATSYQYDEAGRNTLVVNALNQPTRYEYTLNGSLWKMVDAKEQVTEYDYDDNGRRTKTIFDDGSWVETGYDDAGRVVRERDQNGRETFYQYDWRGKLLRVTDALEQETTFTYDEVGNMLTQTDAELQTTRFEYDNLGRMTRRILPLGQDATMIYDGEDNLLETTDFNGSTTVFQYDSNGRVLTKTAPDRAVSYTYAPDGSQDTVTDARGTTTLTYDDMGRLESRSDPQTGVLGYGYDQAGNRTSVTLPSGGVTYTYDELNRLDTVDDPLTGTTRYSYYAVGNLESVRYPNGTKAEYSYDRLNRLIYLKNSRADGTLISSYTYTLDDAGNRTKVAEEPSGRVVEYVYDATNRLEQETITEPGKETRVTSYKYDKVGNRLTKTENGFTTTYKYDANNRMIREDDVIFRYDNNGNLIEKESAEEQILYAYDSENHLIRAETSRYGATIVVEYQYDADGNRVRKTIDNTIVINYLVDTNRDYAQVVEERDSGGNLLVRYVYGHDLISQTRPSAGSGTVTSYYHYDGLGSTRTLTGQSGIVTDTYHYDAFGNLLDKTGVTVNTHLYTGEFFDSHLGFYYLRARYMNPQVGRFVTMDTFAGWERDPYSLHKYLYAHANPVNMLDPSGYMSTYAEITVAGSIIGAMSGIHVYHVTHAPEDRNATGYITWAAGGSLIGGLLAHGAYYIYLAPAANLAPQAGETLKSLAARLEANANRVLAKLESVSHPNSHFFSRHGAQTTLAQQQVRATTGMTPDGVAGRIVDAGRFLTHRAQLRALERALTIFRQTGKKVFEFRLDEIIGEGFLRGGTTYAETSKVLAVFKDGKLLTLYPKLQ